MTNTTSTGIDFTKVAEQARAVLADINRSFAALAEVFRNRREAREAPLSPEQRDRVSKARYDRVVAAERRKGLAFVASETARLRRELGLPCD